MPKQINNEMTPDELRAQMDKTGRSDELRRAFADLGKPGTHRAGVVECIRLGSPRVLVDEGGAVKDDATLDYIAHGKIPDGLRAVRIEDVKVNPDR